MGKKKVVRRKRRPTLAEALPIMPKYAAGAERLLAFLARVTFIEYKFNGVLERVFQKQVFVSQDVRVGKTLTVEKKLIPAFIRIYTSIEGEDFRYRGEDAIRIQGVILNDATLPPTEADACKIVYNKKVLRTKNNIKTRVRSRAREAWQAVVSAWQNPTAPWEKEQAAAVSAEKRAGPTLAQRKFYEYLTGTPMRNDVTMKEASEMIAKAKAENPNPKGKYTGPRRKQGKSGKFNGKSVNKDWEKEPITVKQTAYLYVLADKLLSEGEVVRKDGIKTMTRGQASKIISMWSDKLHSLTGK